MYSVTDRNSDFGFMNSDLMDFGIRIFDFGITEFRNSDFRIRI